MNKKKAKIDRIMFADATIVNTTTNNIKIAKNALGRSHTELFPGWKHDSMETILSYNNVSRE